MAAYLCDVNVWFALQIGTHPHHTTVRTWLDAIDDSETLLFCRATQHGLLRLLSTASIMALHGEPPLTNAEAFRTYETTMSDSRCRFRASEPEGLEAPWRRYAVRPSASPKLWMDAYLAAFALGAGLRLVTTDTAFRQFPGLDLLVLGSAAP